jgi:hypothetical protein
VVFLLRSNCIAPTVVLKFGSNALTNGKGVACLQRRFHTLFRACHPPH